MKENKVTVRASRLMVAAFMEVENKKQKSERTMVRTGIRNMLKDLQTGTVKDVLKPVFPTS